MAKTDNPEEARYHVRAYLAARPLVAQSPETIHRMLSMETTLTLDEVKEALAFLVDLTQVKEIRSALGSSKSYQISAKGQLAEERGE